MSRDELARVYIALLRHPHDAWRAQNQAIYCIVRDRVALERGKSSEAIQFHFEKLVALSDARERA